MKKLKYILFITLIVLVSCKGKEGGGGDGGVDPPPPTPAPKAATLDAPANNSECLDGENVEFKWAASENTDTYEIFIKNLLTQSEQSQTTTSTSVTLNLTKGQPYSWYIVSIKFEWSGSDADSGDTLTFDIYVDSSNPPTTRIKANHNSSSINHPINDSGTYYWKIITKDNSGSNSDSGVSKFKVVN